jgi:glycosylphosphatidylinositol transamidase (GPIT) subunit GPI8
MPWIASESIALQKRLILIEELFANENPIVCDWAQKQYTSLQEKITKAQVFEKFRNQEQIEGFERAD